MTACPFCDYAGPSPVLADYGHVFIIVPVNPVVPGHVLAVPKKHADDAVANPQLASDTVEVAAQYAPEVASACNLITSVGAAATQTVRHLHVHIVPRAEGDGLRLPWT
jgi:histidine triad (HIT) family protein